LAAFAIDDLTAEEEEELLEYLAFRRSRGPTGRCPFHVSPTRRPPLEHLA
jgi:hypothetical protein